MGYDGFNIKSNEKTLYEYYIDPSRPFEYEIVLYCLLISEEYTFHIYYKNSSNKYKDVI